MFCSNCQKALHSNDFGYEMCRKCEVDGLKADLVQSQEQYFEMVELAGKESHRAADLEDEIERLKKSKKMYHEAASERAEEADRYYSRAAIWKTSARTWRCSSKEWQDKYLKLNRHLSTEGKSDSIVLKERETKTGPPGP